MISSRLMMKYTAKIGILKKNAVSSPSGTVTAHMVTASQKRPNLESPPAQKMPAITVEFTDKPGGARTVSGSQQKIPSDTCDDHS